jgi:hypothetical protein
MNPSEASVKTQDIFDKLDIFDIVNEPKLKAYEAPPRMALELTAEIRQLIQSEVSKLAPKEPKEIIHTREIVKQKEMVSPPERVIVKEVDTKALEKAVTDRLKAAMTDYEKNWKNIAPIVVPGPIALQDGQGGKILSTDGRQTKWIAPTTGGSTSSDAYTVNNNTTLRTYDATNTSMDELARVLGSLIASLQGAGIIQ